MLVRDMYTGECSVISFLMMLEQDILSEKSKKDYYREAAQYLNMGERVGAESGEGVSGTLAFLTRGIPFLKMKHDIGLRSLFVYIRYSTTRDTGHR
jgi:hypothetical protein